MCVTCRQEKTPASRTRVQMGFSKAGVSSSLDCKAPRTQRLNRTRFSSPRPRGCEPKIKVLAGLGPSKAGRETLFWALAQLLEVSWHLWLAEASPPSLPSSLHRLVPGRMSVSIFPIRTPVILD